MKEWKATEPEDFIFDLKSQQLTYVGKKPGKFKLTFKTGLPEECKKPLKLISANHKDILTPDGSTVIVNNEDVIEHRPEQLNKFSLIKES